MSDTVMLTARTVFPPEVDISTVRLASRIVWPSETGHTITTPAMEKEGFVVPRPPGEVGRPHDGGFALKAVLGWSNKKYTSVRKFLREQARLYLDTHLPLTRQDDVAVQKVYAAVIQKFPFLANYEGNWVTKAMLEVYLRNSGAHHRQSLG